ncbi:hypothetical protein NDU88_003073 [Pleurodeles waltl]|uniref:Uncharacterized protein n=1 Tax=Pleurodeles waltl TaxID=8319 RepID=A0AAV7VCD1_PLEWA|nr:hypothetical protein NDU88_003073 [Pleurodeles waltl]
MCSGPRSGLGGGLGREAGLSPAAACALYRRGRSPRRFALGPASGGTTEGALTPGLVGTLGAEVCRTWSGAGGEPALPRGSLQDCGGAWRRGQR